MSNTGKSAGDTWMVVQQGDKTDLERLSKACTAPELSVVQKNGVFSLHSTKFAVDDDYNSISQNAERFVSWLNANCKLTFKSRTALRWHSYLARADGTRERAMPLISEDPTRVPDHVFGGPELPFDETVKARFLRV